MTQQLSLWICGPLGKMGTALRQALSSVSDITVTGVVSPEHVGEKCEVGQTSLVVSESLEDLAANEALPDVIVDFTYADAAYVNALFAATHNVHFVTGTTGMSSAQKDEVAVAFSSSTAHAIIASNFSVGAVLMMHFAAQAAQHFEKAEIVEIHHTAKKDAPSGTALTTATMMADSSTFGPDDIEIHSLRLPGAIAHQNVYLSSPGEVLRIEHDANDRQCFMPGVILSIRSVAHITDPVVYSIAKLLFDE